VRAVFGKDFLDALSNAEPGAWQTLRSPDGVHMVRLVKKTAGRRVSVAEARKGLVRAYELERAANREREGLDAASREYRFEEVP
jgi:parvulin-like peptidyl-prolyl isomerase